MRKKIELYFTKKDPAEIIDYALLVQELEYGATFRYDGLQEQVVYPRGKQVKWIDLEILSDTEFKIIFKGNFISADNFFEKVLATVFNFHDFSDLVLNNIMILYPKIFYKREQSTIFLKGAGTIFKPYYHLSRKQKIDFLQLIKSHGGNVMKEDETYLVGQRKILEETTCLQGEFGENGYYVPNITSHVNDYAFVEELINAGVKIVMVDVVLAGFRSIASLREHFPELGIWGHRVGSHIYNQSLSHKAFSKLAVLAGVDFLHLGTANAVKETKETQNLVKVLRSYTPRFVPVFTKTTPEILPALSASFPNSILLTCGYIRNIETFAISIENVEVWFSEVATAWQ